MLYASGAERSAFVLYGIATNAFVVFVLTSVQGGVKDVRCKCCMV